MTLSPVSSHAQEHQIQWLLQTQSIISQTKDFGPPLHTIVIPGNLHFMEIEALELCADLPVELKTKIQKL